MTTVKQVVDVTPNKVLAGRIEPRNLASLSSPCVPCDGVIRICIFFDAFGRNREIDAGGARYSNIARMYDAAREMRSRERPPTEYWLRFYLSGMATPLNDDAENNAAINLAVQLALRSGKALNAAASKTVNNVGMADEYGKLGGAAKKAARDLMFSEKPVDEVFTEFAKKAKQTGRQFKRFLKSPMETLERRFRAAYRKALYEAKNLTVRDLLRLPNKAIKLLGQDLIVENVPVLRDHATLAAVVAAGFDTRVEAGLRAVENAVQRLKEANPRIKRVEVSVFGADRGGAMAQVFVNELVGRHGGAAQNLLVHELPCEIKFVGLFDCVSSVMEGNELLSMIPVVGLVKQNFKDKPLGIPSGTPSLHCIAGHELRFYQRIDAVPGVQTERFYPGSSEDVTGGAPEGTNGLRTALARVPLRDMMNAALQAGANLHSMQELETHNPRTFALHMLAAEVDTGNGTFNVKDLVEEYWLSADRPESRISDVTFERHMRPFIQWLAVRSLDPVFRASIDEPLRDDTERVNQRVRIEARNAAGRAYNEELKRQQQLPNEERNRPENRQRIRTLAEEHERLKQEVLANQHAVTEETYRHVLIEGVWERLDREARELEKIRREELSDTGRQIRQLAPPRAPGNEGIFHLGMTERPGLTPECARLIDAWSIAQRNKQATGDDPLPQHLMAMFDMLVHDTMLTSWHDHLLSHGLYFKTRGIDQFGAGQALKKAA